MTLDIDILIHERDTQATRAALIEVGYQIVSELSIGGFSAQRTGQQEPPLDVLTRQDGWLDQALAQPAIDPAGYPVLGRPYLILIKLQAGRTQDLADIQRLLARVPPPEREAIANIIKQHSPELAEDYESLCTLADLEFGPPSAP